MSRRPLIAVTVVIALTVVAGALVGRPGQAAVGCVIAVTVLTALLVVGELADRADAPATGGTVARERTELARLRALDRAVESAVTSPVAFDRELRPLVRSIATTRLARLGIDGDVSPAAAEAVLGRELSEWIRGDATGPTSDRSHAHLQAIVDRLERI